MASPLRSMLKPVLAGLAPLPSAAVVVSPLLDLRMLWLGLAGNAGCWCTSLLSSRCSACDMDGVAQRTTLPLQTA